MSIQAFSVSAMLIASVPQPGFEATLKSRFHPIVGENAATPNCYAQTNTSTKFDLSRLCRFVPSNTPVFSDSYGGASGGGICNAPTDDSACDGRTRRE